MCNALLARKHTQSSTRSQFDSPARAGDTIIRGPKLEDDGGKTRQNPKKHEISYKVMIEPAVPKKRKILVGWPSNPARFFLIIGFFLWSLHANSCKTLYHHQQLSLPLKTLPGSVIPFELSEANCRRKASTLNEFHARGRASWNKTLEDLVSLHHCILFADLLPSAHHKICRVERVGHDYNIKKRPSNPVVSPFFWPLKTRPKGIWNQLNEDGW